MPIFDNTNPVNVNGNPDNNGSAVDGIYRGIALTGVTRIALYTPGVREFLAPVLLGSNLMVVMQSANSTQQQFAGQVVGSLLETGARLWIGTTIASPIVASVLATAVTASTVFAAKQLYDAPRGASWNWAKEKWQRGFWASSPSEPPVPAPAVSSAAASVDPGREERINGRLLLLPPEQPLAAPRFSVG